MKPNPDEFAKEVLWKLALANAQIDELKQLVCELLSTQTGQPVEEFQKKWKAKSRERAVENFRASAEGAGYQDPPIPDDKGNWDLN